MQFLMLNVWKGCSFPVNFVKEQKDWEALVEHFLPSARAVTQIHMVFTPSAHLGNHITQPGCGVALHRPATPVVAGMLSLVQVCSQCFHGCAGAAAGAVCVSSSHTFGECSQNAPSETRGLEMATGRWQGAVTVGLSTEVTVLVVK